MAEQHNEPVEVSTGMRGRYHVISYNVPVGHPLAKQINQVIGEVLNQASYREQHGYQEAKAVENAAKWGPASDAFVHPTGQPGQRTEGPDANN